MANKPTSRVQLIITELARCNQLVRGSDTREEIRAFAQELNLELEVFETDEIQAAIREHARIGRWMPKLAELLDLCRRHHAALDFAKNKQLEIHEMPEEQRQLNIARIATLKNKLAQKRQMKSMSRRPRPRRF